jgi:hypothetical protein
VPGPVIDSRVFDKGRHEVNGRGRLTAFVAQEDRHYESVDVRRERPFWLKPSISAMRAFTSLPTRRVGSGLCGMNRITVFDVSNALNSSLYVSNTAPYMTYKATCCFAVPMLTSDLPLY